MLPISPDVWPQARRIYCQYVCIAAIHMLRDFCVTASFLQVAASFKVQPRPLLLLPTPAALLPLLQLLLQATPLPRQPPLLPGAPSTAALLQPLQLRATVLQLLPLLLPAALASALAPQPRPLPRPAAALTAGLPLLLLLPVMGLQQLLHLLPVAPGSAALLHHRLRRLGLALPPVLQLLQVTTPTLTPAHPRLFQVCIFHGILKMLMVVQSVS